MKTILFILIIILGMALIYETIEAPKLCSFPIELFDYSWANNYKELVVRVGTENCTLYMVKDKK
mgnify:CR=1 FL=1